MSFQFIHMSAMAPIDYMLQPGVHSILSADLEWWNASKISIPTANSRKYNSVDCCKNIDSASLKSLNIHKTVYKDLFARE